MRHSRWEERQARRERREEQRQQRREQRMGTFSPNKIYKNRREGRWCGVCAGLGEYFGIDPTILRVALILLSIFGFFFPVIISYFILCWVLEDKPDYLYENPREDAFWREARTRPDYTRVDLARRFRDIEKRARAVEAYITSKQYRLNKEINDLDRQGT
ncbi:MAG TPA: envelope stress response membrane protein PspC [Alphaproteobacteria bacterium]|nr:envelope stress response membrane protein PspC [Alphaproteobacteria bacterium]